MEGASVCAVAASSSDNGGPEGATSVYRSCCFDMGSKGVAGGREGGTGGARVGGEGEGRGWTHSLLLIIDQYMHWSPLIPDRFKPPLLSLPAHQSALQQRGGIGEVEGNRYDWKDFLYFCLVLSFILQRQKQVLHFIVNHAPCDIQPFGAKDCSGTSKTCIKCIIFKHKKREKVFSPSWTSYKL